MKLTNTEHACEIPLAEKLDALKGELPEFDRNLQSLAKKHDLEIIGGIGWMLSTETV